MAELRLLLLAAIGDVVADVSARNAGVWLARSYRHRDSEVGADRGLVGRYDEGIRAYV